MGQGGVAERHEQATNQLKRAAMEVSERCLTNIQKLADWQSARPELLRQLRNSLGLEPLPVIWRTFRSGPSQCEAGGLFRITLLTRSFSRAA